MAAKHKPKVHKGADRHHAKGGGNRHTNEHRGKGRPAGRLPGDEVTAYPFMRDNAMRRPKAPEPDNVGRKTRPAAHNKRQTGVAKRAARTVKRLSNQVI